VTVAFAPGQPSQQLRVVGRLVLNVGPMDTAIAPSKGMVIDFEAVRRLAPPSPSLAPAPQVYLVRLDSAADQRRSVEPLQRAFPGTVVRPLPHPDIDNVRRILYLPALLAGLMALLAWAR
jgi:hypothetical protein